MTTNSVDFAVLSELGGRSSMEDVYTLDFDFLGRGWIFGGVYDGHGSDRPAKVASQEIPVVFGDKLKHSWEEGEAFKRAYSLVSRRMTWAHDCGTTAVNFLIRDRRIFHANAGDSRLFVVGNRMKELSVEHRLDDPREAGRIIDHGGEIRGHYVYAGGFNGQ